MSGNGHGWPQGHRLAASSMFVPPGLTNLKGQTMRILKFLGWCLAAILILSVAINFWFLVIPVLVIIYFLPKRMVGNKIERVRLKIRKLLHSKPATTAWVGTRKLLRTKPAIIALLILFFPIGLYLMWRYTDWGKTPKFVISGLGTVGIVGVFIVVIVFAPPTIAIKSSTAAISGSQYSLEADVTPDNATVSVNGKQLSLGSNGHLNTQLDMAQGDNQITIVARGTNNRVTQQVITVHRYTTAELAKQAQDTAKQKADELAQQQQDAADQAAADKAAQQQAASDAAAQKAAQQQSDLKAIKAVVDKVITGKNDVGGYYYRKVDVEPQVNGGFGVFVDYNADESGSNKNDKVLYITEATLIYKAIYTTGKDIRTASVSAWFAGSDSYGNNVDKLVYKTILDKPVADKVNWNAPDITTLDVALPNLWSVTLDYLQ